MGTMRWLLLLALLGACASEDLELQVDLRTDYAPGVEFDLVRTSVDDGDAVEVMALDEPSAAADYLRGIRVAEIGGLSAGRREVRVALVRSADGTEVASRDVVVRLDASTTVTVTLARSCGIVECPGPGDDPTATECSAGRCQPPECDGGPCGEPECVVDADCDGMGLAACASPRCEEGTCFVFRDDAACAEGEFCAPMEGCTPIDPADAGSADAGPPIEEVCNAADDDGDGRIDESGCAGCPVETVGSSTYARCRETVDWIEARDRCQSWGYELVAIEGATEDAVIDGFIDADADVWTALNDRTSEGEFVWAGRGPLGAYDDWDPETMEPNGTRLDGQDCVRIESDTRRWRDTRCAEAHAFVCELD